MPIVDVEFGGKKFTLEGTDEQVNQGLLAFTSAQRKPEESKTFGGILKKSIDSTLINPALETLRGFNKGVGRFSETVGELADIPRRIAAPAARAVTERIMPGVPADVSERIGREEAQRARKFNPFLALHRLSEEVADDIPRGPFTDTWIGSMYNFIGEAPALLGEFFLAKGALRKSGLIKGVSAATAPTATVAEKGARTLGNRILSAAARETRRAAPEAATFATVAGAESLARDLDPVKAAKAATGAALVGGLATIGLNNFTRAYEIGKTLGVQGFMKWMRVLGISRDSIEAFLKNPGRFRLFRKIENSSIKKEQFQEEIFNLQLRQKGSAFEFKAAQDAKRFNILRSQERRLDKLKSSHDTSRSELQSRTDAAIRDLELKSREAIAGFKEKQIGTAERLRQRVNASSLEAEATVRANLDNRLGNVFQRVERLKKDAGERVGAEIELFLQGNPFAQVPAKPIRNNLRRVLQDFGFKVGIGRTGIISPKIVGVDTGEIKRLNAIWRQMHGTITKENGLTVAYLQDLKSAFQKLAVPKDARNITPFEALYSQLSREVNVANMGDFVPQAIKANMSKIFKANADFSAIKGQRDRLFKIAGRKQLVEDASSGRMVERVIPDTDKMLLALSGRKPAERRALTEMEASFSKMADRLKKFGTRPEELRLVNSVEASQKQLQTIVSEKRAALKSIDRKMSRELESLKAEKQRLIKEERAIRDRISAESKKRFVTERDVIEHRNRLSTFERDQKIKRRQFELRREQEQDLFNKQEQVRREKEFLDQQDQLRSIVPPGIFGRGSMIFLANEILKGNVIGGTAGLAALTPRIAAGTFRTVSKSSGAIERRIIENARLVEPTTTALRRTLVLSGEEDE